MFLMSSTCKTWLFWLHVVGGVYNLAFIYTPLHNWSHGFAIVQYLSTPMLVMSGILLVCRRKMFARQHKLSHGHAMTVNNR